MTLKEYSCCIVQPEFRVLNTFVLAWGRELAFRIRTLTFSRSVAATGRMRVDCVVRLDGKDRGEESRLIISCPDLQIGQNVRVEE